MDEQVTEPNEVEKATEEPNKEVGSSVFMTAMNIANNIIGSGIISLPLAVKDSGIFLGLIMLSFSSVLCGWTLTSVAMTAVHMKTSNYEQTSEVVLGKVFRYLMVYCNFFFPFSGALAYGVGIVDNLCLVFKFAIPSATILQYRAITAMIPFFLVILPLSCLENLKFLDKFSTLSVFLVLFYIFTIIFRSFSIPAKIVTIPSTYDLFRGNFFKALPVFAFACSCHHNAISLFQSMKNGTISKFNKSKNIAILISTVLYGIVATCGFVSFGGYPQGNIFNNYCTEDILVAFTRFIFAITLMLTAPMQVFGSRQVLINNLFADWKENQYIRSAVACAIVIVSYVVASTVTSLNVIVELGGALAGVPTIYILPSIFALKLYGKPYYPRDFKTSLAWGVALFGMSMIIVGPILTLVDFFSGANTAGIPKYYCTS